MTIFPIFCGCLFYPIVGILICSSIFPISKIVHFGVLSLGTFYNLGFFLLVYYCYYVLFIAFLISLLLLWLLYTLWNTIIN